MPIIQPTAYNSTRTCTNLIRALLNDAGVNAAIIGIASIARLGNVVTVTTVGAHPYAAGDQVTIAGVVGGATAFNGTFTVVSNASTTQFTFQQVGPSESGNANTGSAVGVNTGAVFTDGMLLPYVNSAYRHVQRALAMTGSTTFITDNTEIIVPAIAAADPSVQVIVNDATAPPNNLPYDLLYPLTLWERPSGTAQQFVEMTDLTESGGLPSRYQASNTLGIWAWESDGLRFVGALADVQVRIRYAKQLPDLTDGSSAILIRNAIDAIAYEAAGMAALARGSPLAQSWDEAGTDSLEALIAASTRKQQYSVRRRRPFSSRSAFGVNGRL